MRRRSPRIGSSRDSHTVDMPVSEVKIVFVGHTSSSASATASGRTFSSGLSPSERTLPSSDSSNEGSASLR